MRLTSKTLANHKANARAALRWLAGEEGLPVRGVPLDERWAKLRDLIRDKSLRARLYGLMRYASAKRIAPEAMTDEVLGAYLLYRGETTALASDRMAARSIGRSWNRCVAEIPAWPSQRLSIPHALPDPALLAHFVELRAGHAHVVGLDGEDARRRFHELLLLQDGGSAGIGRDADILKEHPAEKEIHIVGEGIELGEPRSLGGSREPSLEIDRRTADRLPAKRLAIEADMSQLVLGQFFGELANGFALKIDFAPSFDVARIRAGVGRIDAFAHGGTQIVLGFHVFEIERELENVLIFNVRALCNAGRRTGRGAQACGGKGLERIAA
jgi:hypothetical protein